MHVAGTAEVLGCRRGVRSVMWHAFVAVAAVETRLAPYTRTSAWLRQLAQAHPRTCVLALVIDVADRSTKGCCSCPEMPLHTACTWESSPNPQVVAWPATGTAWPTKVYTSSHLVREQACRPADHVQPPTEPPPSAASCARSQHIPHTRTSIPTRYTALPPAHPTVNLPTLHTRDNTSKPPAASHTVGPACLTRQGEGWGVRAAPALTLRAPPAAAAAGHTSPSAPAPQTPWLPAAPQPP